MRNSPSDLRIPSCTGSGILPLRTRIHAPLGAHEGESDAKDGGATVWLTSGYSGVAHQGTLDGREVRIRYDWCFNGVPDVHLVMAR